MGDSDMSVNNLEAQVDKEGVMDNQSTFQYLMDTVDGLFEHVSGALDLQEDMACADVATIPDLGGNKYGEMRTFTGKEAPVDWLVKSWLGNPVLGFTNIHLTVYCDATIDVPHLGFALGTVGSNVFFYADLIPRYETMLNPEHLEYLEPLNAMALELKNPANGVPQFNSQSAFIRGSLSPVALCGLCDFATLKEKVMDKLKHYVTYWTELVSKAEKVDVAASRILQARDVAWRKNLTELDPANVFADKACGKEMRERLVRCLQGADRAIPAKTFQ